MTVVIPGHRATQVIQDLEVYLELLVTLETKVLMALLAASVPQG